MTTRPPGTLAARDLVRVAFAPSAVALLIVAALVLLQLVIANSDLTGAFGAIASLWLAVHQVPVSIGGHELGVLPLLPVLAMVWGTARVVMAAVHRETSATVLRWVAASALGGPLLLTAVALAVIHDASTVLTQLQTPSALRAFGGVLVVHGAGAVLGIGARLMHRAPLPLGLPRWVPEAVRAAAAGVLALCGLSGAVAVGSLVVHWSALDGLYGITDSAFGQASLTVLSALYLPNIMVGSAAVAVGSSAHIGLASFSSFAVLGGDVPAVPVLAAVPTPPLGPIWVALLIVAAASAVVCGQQAARRPEPPGAAVAKLLTAAVLAAVTMAVLGYAAGGELGNFGSAGVDQATFGPAVLLWFAGVGGLTVAMSGGVSRGAQPVRTAARSGGASAGPDLSGPDLSGPGLFGPDTAGFHPTRPDSTSPDPTRTGASGSVEPAGTEPEPDTDTLHLPDREGFAPVFGGAPRRGQPPGSAGAPDEPVYRAPVPAEPPPQTAPAIPDDDPEAHFGTDDDPHPAPPADPPPTGDRNRGPAD